MTDGGLVWFPDLGFRPAVWTPPHRADGVDYPRLVVAPDADVPLVGKFDAYAHVPASGYAWGTWIPLPHAPQITAASLAGPVPPAPWYPATPTLPPHPEPWTPCCIIREPDTPLPPMSPVPLPASGWMLLVGLVVLALMRRRK